PAWRSRRRRCRSFCEHWPSSSTARPAAWSRPSSTGMTRPSSSSPPRPARGSPAPAPQPSRPAPCSRPSPPSPVAIPWARRCPPPSPPSAPRRLTARPCAAPGSRSPGCCRGRISRTPCSLSVPVPECDMAFDLDRFALSSEPVKMDDLDFSAFEREPLDAATLRSLRYMCDVEYHTSCCLRDLLVTPSHREEEAGGFMTMWNREEFWHGEALSAVLSRHGINVDYDEVKAKRVKLGWREAQAPMKQSALAKLAG